MPHETDPARQEVAALVGRSIKAKREAGGFTQRELADQLVRYLPSWTYNTVAATEVGRREPSLIETLVLGSVFGCTLGELLPVTKDDDVHLGPLALSTAVEQLTGNLALDLERLRSINIAMSSPSEMFESNLSLLRENEIWSNARELGLANEQMTHELWQLLASLPPRPEGPGDPDRFAAKKFGLTVDEIVEIATRLYGHSLYVERWRRECAVLMLHRGLPDEYRGLLRERSSKGTRIGISRNLMAEIAPEARALGAKDKGETP